MIRLRNLTFTYNGTGEPALKNVDLTINDGEFVLITGSSGGGKSTLCRCFNGLVPHFYGGAIKGSLEVQGRDIIRTSPKEMALKVGMVFQDPENQMVTTDVEREIAFGLENLGFPVQLISRRIEEALDTIGIAGLRFRRHDELSGGEKQKVAIASVLALHPEVLVLDEPTSELDPQSAEEVLRILERLNDELGITVILIEHRLDRVVHLVDKVLVMNEGTIQAFGPPGEIMKTDFPGLGIPPVIKLMRLLQDDGRVSGELPLTVKEARLKLQGILGNANPALLPDNNGGGERTLNIENLWHAYGEHTSLRNINITINKGEFIAVMGRNASGKTTLVKQMNGLIRPNKGKVVMDGADIKHSSVAELSQKVGYVFQNPNDHLFADTVEDEITFSLANRGVSPEDINDALEYMLKQFRLSRYRRSYPRNLSGGEKQRLALATVLVNKPEILILDEPTRGMDYILKRDLIRFLREYCVSGNTVVMVTHDVETVAESADRVILMSEGRVVVDGSKREVLSKALLFSPQINRLAQALHSHGIADTTLTVNEMMEQIQ